MTQSTFERYGGFATVSKVVLAFYEKVMESDVLADYFESVDMRRLVDHQTQFVSQLMGGPVAYTDDMLRQLHARLGVHDEAFDEMVELFTETLEDFELDDDDIDAIAGELSVRRPLIVTVGEDGRG
ncbi:MAG: group 1 truncated hemoglobin [Gemmatimonadota bacterium]|nr:group 1 truncated hemoglobin [Gemmatimonadota bacterium]